MMKHYVGDRTIDGVSVEVDGQPLSPGYDRLQLTEHGFEWSYEGREPAQLAFALLLDHLDHAAMAANLHEPFMKHVVANFDNTWEMTSADIDAAISALRQAKNVA